MASNPYQTPAADGLQRRGMVGHVRPLAILMIVQGAFEAPMGLYISAFSFMISDLIRGAQRDSLPEGETGPYWSSPVYLLAIGAITTVAGGLHIYAGWRVFLFRARALGIVALAWGCLTVFSCYCAPSAVALALYGLIVLRNAETKIAFQSRGAASSAGSIGK